MPLVYFIRHGETQASAENPLDPQLSPPGRLQAQAVAAELASTLSVAPILTSPLLRCRETAASLSERWKIRAAIEPRVSEVPMPRQEGLSRKQWLQQALRATWEQVGSQGETLQPGYARDLALWRQRLYEVVMEQSTDTVIFSHYVPINALVGLASGRNTITCFHPDYASVTVFEVRNAAIHIVQQGRETPTRVS